MKNPRAVAERIAELHNESVKPLVKRAEPVKDASTVGDKVIRLVENAVEDASARTAEESIEFNRKLLEIAHANIHAYFEWLHELVRVNSPQEFTAVCMKHSQQQFETFRQQTRELANLAQEAAIENMGPLGTLFGNALIGRPLS
jgi:hypothetical protein